MKKTFLLAAVVASSLSLAGCGSTEGNRAAGGAVLGGAAGAAIGGLATGRASGALAGAAVGAASGAIVGAATTPRRRCERVGYDYYGNRVCMVYSR
ncbi:MAG TPA: glycine zipper domain-containing protein [Beijerinckiaceae bacterium]|nr:glycine zipper domain-containing protein [Beijerinckiaceae bacterium]